MGARGGGEKERQGVYVHKIDIDICLHGLLVKSKRQLCTYVSMHTYIVLNIYIDVYTNTRTHIHTHTHTQTHTYTYTHTQTHTHILNEQHTHTHTRVTHTH